MKVRRFTIAKAMIVTAVVAVDLAWLRIILFGTRSVVGIDTALHLANGFLFDFGLFGMFNLLALGLFRLSSVDGDQKWFLVGFEVVGLLAMLIYWCCCCKWGAWYLPEPSLGRSWGLFSVGQATNDLVRVVGVEPKLFMSKLGCNPVVCAVYTALLASPQFLVAVLGGSLVRRAANRRGGEGQEETKAVSAPAVDGPQA